MSIKLKALKAAIRAANRLRAKKNLKSLSPYNVKTKTDIKYKFKQKPVPGGREVNTQISSLHPGASEASINKKTLGATIRRMPYIGSRESWNAEMTRMYGGVHMSQDPKRIKKSLKLLRKKLKKKKVKKLLAGGLLYPGIRVAVKYARPLWKVATKKIYKRAGETTMSKLQIKLNKASDLQKNFSKMQLKDLTSSQLKDMSKFLPKLKAYKTKIKDTAKAWLEKEYRYGKSKKVLHSEGGEVIIGKNVDKGLL